MERIVVPAREGRAVELAKGKRIRVITPKGPQAADFFAYNAANVSEWLSPMHSWVASRHLRPRQGDIFRSRFRRPMLDFVEDGAEGVHDMFLAACDKLRYEMGGFEGPHASCSENLQIAMRRLGHEVSVIPQPVNLFTHTVVEPDGTLVAPPNPVKPGAYAELEARMDLICVISACPFDMGEENWAVNAPGGPTEIEIELR